MDKSLDDVITERQNGGNRGQRNRRRNDWPRDGVKKSGRAEPRNMDRDWVHDKFDDDDSIKPSRGPSSDSRNRYSPEPNRRPASGAKVRIDNLHYDLGEEDLENLFSRKGQVLKVDIRYDRAGRSEGIAFVTYDSVEAAKAAIGDFDGANANGQPIRLTLTPGYTSTAASSTRPRNPFDTAQKPSRSLFDRISEPPARSRSLSPDRNPPIRHSDVSKPPPSHIDRYVPGQSRNRTRSPMPPHRGGDRGGRRPGGRRDDRERGFGREGRGSGRPKKTQEELDAEMEDYFTSQVDGAEGGNTASAPVAAPMETDVDMAE